MRRQRGVTLPEVLVATAILAVLTGVAWALLGPATKRKGLETRVRSDLRQIAAGIAAYSAQHDDGLPNRLSDVKGVPLYFPNWKSHSAGFPVASNGSYTMTYNVATRAMMRRYGDRLRHRFEPAIQPIVKASFFARETPPEDYVTYGPMGQPEIRMRGPRIKVLGARLDGSVDWSYFLDPWEEEIATFPLVPAKEYRNE